ncbi:hypothetical protein MASR2M78_20220 [Treponema sp.]
MYRVLIVDDEEPVLDSYAFLLKAAGSDFILAGKGRSGYEAIQLIHELKPDLVFMDINIPGMDGIDVIAELHEKYPQTVFILSTAYERFDLAQRAIPLGVFAYLVKPVSKKTFLDTLESVRLVLDKRSPPLPLQGTEYAEKQFLREAIWKPMDAKEWETYRGLFSFHSDKGIVMLMEAEEDAARWGRELVAQLSFRHRCLYTQHLHRIVFFIPEDLDRHALQALMTQAMKAVVPEGLFCAFALGSVQQGLELHLSCAEALEELRRKRSRVDVQLRERLRIAQLRRKIGIAELEEVQKLFVALWEEIFACYDFSVAKAKMVGFFSLLMDDGMGCFSCGSEEEPPFSPAEEIMPLRDLEEWTQWSRQSIADLQSLFSLRRSSNFPLPLVKAISYINGHFTEQVQLSSVADAAQVSGAYLSRLFTEHLHSTFVDFVTELRIGRAEELIRESRMSIKEIAYAVGYQDPNYFTKIFRKATGLVPSLYGAERRAEREQA